MLLIGALVYAVLRFLQGTRGARLVRAVLIILAVSFMVVWLVAERFGFERINVLYPFFMLGVFLASMVAFQTELRRMLIRLGQGGFLRHWIKGTPELIEPIITAVERLAKSKTGALIAIERTTELGGLIESGVTLDAVVSTELIENIFYEGAPLHDLGMIIHDGRIRAAGCQFPLAESGDVDRALGSRHRAAVGMSAEVDAIVIIVSEETGTISVAVDGQLHRTPTIRALRDTLAIELAAAPHRSADEPHDTTPVTKATTNDAGQAA